MAVSLSPFPMLRFVDSNGNALSGGKLFTYTAGTTTKLATYTDSTGGTPNSNPVILNARGEASVWLTQGSAYKLVLAPSTDTDPPSNAIWTVDQVLAAPATGRLLNIQSFTAGGTYTPTAGTNSVMVMVIGAGASGGSTGTTTGSCGGGGGAGGAALYFGANPGTQTVTIGTAGAAAVGNGGGGTGNAGNNGGTTSFGAICSATGGSAGQGAPASATAAGGAGGTGSGGNVWNVTGGMGGDGQVNTNGTGGVGGNSVLSGAGRAGTTGGSAGGAYGAGGGAAYNAATQPSGAGKGGICIVWEFS